MKTVKSLLIFLLLVTATGAKSQHDSICAKPRQFNIPKLTIEPGVGIHPMPIMDMRFSNIIQFNARKHLNFVSYSYYTRHNAFLSTFNNIHTDYSLSLSQMVGLGTAIHTRNGSHNFVLLGGVKMEAFKETLDNPAFDKVTASSKAITPEFALMYNGKLGQKKYFFSYRVYLPLSPYPLNTPDFNALDGNLSNVSLEVGLGIRIK